LKKIINEIVVVEGREDTRNLLKYFQVTTIETHGYGISEETWEKLDRAYKEPGLIIFTDPDHQGRLIRERLIKRYPEAKMAFVCKEEALAKGKAGVEHCSFETLQRALDCAKAIFNDREESVFTYEDLRKSGLTGTEDAGRRREAFCKYLGIGYGNSKGLLKKLKGFNITRSEFDEALSAICLKEPDGEL